MSDVLTEAEQKVRWQAHQSAFVTNMTDAEARQFGDSMWEAARDYYKAAPEPSQGAMSFLPEPCGQCGHDVNDHAYDEENEMAHDCELCGCDGFITKTQRTEAKYEPFAPTHPREPER